MLIVPASVVAEDLDLNGFPDANEQALVDRFCPSLVLNSLDRQESPVCPEPVEIITGKIWNSWRDLTAQSYRGVTFRLNTTDVNYSLLTNSVPEQGYPPQTTYDGCFQNSPPLSEKQKHYDYGDPGEECEWQSSHWKDQPTNPEGGWYTIYDQGVGGAFRGADYPHTVYAHPFSFVEDNETQLVIQYWFFYPFNDWVNNHEGDWEHINVFITSDDPNSSQIDRVVYYFHERYTIAADTQIEYPNGPFDCYVVDGTHPVVFVGGSANETDCEFGVCDNGAGNGSHGSYTMPGVWNNVNERGYEDEPDGVGLWIPWSQIVDNDDSDLDGVVLLKERNAYNYAAKPWMSWHNANISWGHPNVWSMGSNHTELIGLFGGTSIGSESPNGPAYQDTWNAPYGTERFLQYIFVAPHPNASDANWSPPPRMVLTFPGQNAEVFGELVIQGTIHYADEVTLDWGVGADPTEWSELGTSVEETPVVDSAIGRWNTGYVPGGTYTIRIRSTYGGQISEAVRTVSVLHRTVSVAQVGGDFATIQEGIDYAATGDTVRVAMGGAAYPPTSLTMKAGVHLVATGGPVRDVFGLEDTPTIRIEDHDQPGGGSDGPPSTIDGFTFRHNHAFPSAPGSSSEHGAIIDGSSPAFRNCTFKYNVADRGGGVLVIASPGRVTRPIFENCKFIGNRGNNDAGAIAIEDVGTPPKTGQVGFECYDCEFAGNFAGQASGGTAVSAAYIDAQGEPLVLADCSFSEHEQASTVILLAGVTDANFTNCVFFDNSTIDLVHMDHHSRPTFDRCTFAKNYGVDGVFGWSEPNNGFPDISRSIIAFNNGPVSIGSSGLTTSIELVNTIVFANLDQGRGPSDAAWDAAWLSAIRIDPAFCSTAGFDFRLFAYSPASAPTLPNLGYFGERVGAFDVGCVPSADVTASSSGQIIPEKPWIVVACPQGDQCPNAAKDLVVTVDLDGSITRDIDWREVVLDAADCVSTTRVFDQSGFVEAGAEAVGPDYVATITHSYWGGYGVNDVDVLLNGHPLGPVAHFDLRTSDIMPDGQIDLGDFAIFGNYYPPGDPPKPYSSHVDYDDDGTVELDDFATFASHYNHAAPEGYLQLNPSSQPVESDAGISLQFSEEFPTANSHRLYVDVTVENFADVTTSVFSMRTGSDRLTFVEWLPEGNAVGEVLFTPVVRDGAQELFYGLFVSESYSAVSGELGRLVFDVTGTDPIEISDDNFVLMVGDVLLESAGSGQAVAAQMRGVFDRTFDPAVARIYHNRLEQNFPNPFNPTTTLSFSIKDAGSVNLTIYDVAGRRIRELVNERRERGAYKVVWDGQNDAGQTVASGVYFYKLVAASFTDTKKMTILK